MEYRAAEPQVAGDFLSFFSQCCTARWIRRSGKTCHNLRIRAFLWLSMFCAPCIACPTTACMETARSPSCFLSGITQQFCRHAMLSKHHTPWHVPRISDRWFSSHVPAWGTSWPLVSTFRSVLVCSTQYLLHVLFIDSSSLS